MKKSLKVIGIVFIIIAILFALAWIWASGLKEDQKLTKKTMKLILESYENFNNRFFTQISSLYFFLRHICLKSSLSNLSFSSEDKLSLLFIKIFFQLVFHSYSEFFPPYQP